MTTGGDNATKRPGPGVPAASVVPAPSPATAAHAAPPGGATPGLPGTATSAPAPGVELGGPPPSAEDAELVARRVGMLRMLALFLGGVLVAWALLPWHALGEHRAAVAVHAVLEFLPLFIAAAVFAVGWEATVHAKQAPLAIVSAGFFGVAVLDLLHTLSYEGMPDLVTPSSPEKAENFWYAARAVSASTLLLVAVWNEHPLTLQRTSRRRAMATVMVVAALVAVLGLFFPGTWPTEFLPTGGLRTFRFGIEGTLIATHLAAGVLLWRNRQLSEGLDSTRLAGAAFVLAMAEGFLVRNGALSDVFTILGHLYKAAAFGLIYSSVVRQGLRAPYARLARSEQRLANEVRQKEAALTDLSRHSWALLEMNRLSGKLVACQEENEAWNIVSSSGWRLFTTRGYLAVSREELGELEVTATWGDWGQTPPTRLPADSCWGLRANRPHLRVPGDEHLRCRHPLAESPHGTLCVPLLLDGRLLGALHVGVPALSQGVADAQAPWRQLVDLFASAITSSLSNLQLRTSLREQATHDALTHLHNRRALDEALPRELHRSLRAEEPLAVAMIDVDHFKRLNDTFGHEAGDAVLRSLGRLLQEKLRFSDFACRYGGEEFVIVMPGMSASQAMARLDGLRREIGEHTFSHRGRNIGPATVSVGIAQAPVHGTQATDLLRAADLALYAAKEGGRNRTVVSNTYVAVARPGHTA